MTRVLIVDDSEDTQDTYEQLLAGEGYDVSRVSDGTAALHAVTEERPDVVLLDMMMPDVDGLQLLARLPLECPAPRPAVVVSSGFEAFREEALRRGAVAFLRKPVEIDVLLGALRAAVGRWPVPPDVLVHNRQDVVAAREHGEKVRRGIVAELAPLTVDQVRARLRALAGWLQRYYGFGATFIQLLRGDELRIEATRGGSRPWLEGHQYARGIVWCHDVLEAGATMLLCDPLHHALPYFSQHPEIAAGFRFYAGVPLTTWSGAVIGTLCICDVEPHVLHAEDMRLLEALGLHVARALEEVADGVDADDFVIDEDGMFAAELLPTFVQVGLARVARTGGAVGIAIVRLADAGAAHEVARAAYAAADGAGLALVRRAPDEIALVDAGGDAQAHLGLAAAIAACRAAGGVRSIGTGWCRLSAGAQAVAESDLAARLISLAVEARDPVTPRRPASPHELGIHAA